MRVRVRMYRQGLGDCFLLSFFTGPQPVHALIDCGTLGATTTPVKMKDVVENILEETKGQDGKGHLRLLIATHEHKDHLSGFLGQQKIFDDIKVDNVWLAWTEDKNDSLAQEIKKYKNDLLYATRAAVNALGHQAAQDCGRGIRRLLSFYGDVPDEGALGAQFAESINDAMNYVIARAPGGQPEFHSPGKLLEPDWLPGVRFYVLGPPRNKKKISQMGEHGDTELYELAGGLSTGFAASAKYFPADQSWNEYAMTLEGAERDEFERGFPFDLRYRLDGTNADLRQRYYEGYDDPTAAWRKIDADWLTAAADFALQLDSYTNNTSLALAIEFIEDARVLLFPADAQMGNWLSWHDASMKWQVKGPSGNMKEVTAEDLLRNTVFYKVGHHASHNATMKNSGLEMMKSEDLVAFIPVDGQVAMNKTPPWKMPAATLYKELLKKTKGRVLRSDIGWPKDTERPSTVTQAEWKQSPANAQVTLADSFIDFLLD